MRVAASQFKFCHTDSFESFKSQIETTFEKCKKDNIDLLVFPEYFTAQLSGLIEDSKGDYDLFRKVAGFTEPVVELFSNLAGKYKLYVVAGSVPVIESEKLYNDSYFFAPSSKYGVQGKLHSTAWEKKDLDLSTREDLKVFKTELGTIAINICYDIEFPEVARKSVELGADVIVVPSWTDDIHGFWRVRYCAQARCVENHIYVVHSSAVGELRRVGGLWGQSGIYSPSDEEFPVNAVLAEGKANEEDLVIASLDLSLLEAVRKHGHTTPQTDKNGVETKLNTTSVVELT